MNDPGGLTVKSDGLFSFEGFITEHENLPAECFLPSKLGSFWIDGVLNSLASGRAEDAAVGYRIIHFACTILLCELVSECTAEHTDLFLQELMLERVERINLKAGITNSGLMYMASDIESVFSGVRYSEEDKARLLNMVVGAIKWEKESLSRLLLSRMQVPS